MELFKEIQNNKLIYILILLLFLFGIYLYYLINKNKINEFMSNTELQDINIDSIRNLASICDKLTNKNLNDLTIPGTLTIDTVNIGTNNNKWSISKDNNDNLIIKKGLSSEIAPSITFTKI